MFITPSVPNNKEILYYQYNITDYSSDKIYLYKLSVEFEEYLQQQHIP